MGCNKKDRLIAIEAERVRIGSLGDSSEVKSSLHLLDKIEVAVRSKNAWLFELLTATNVGSRDKVAEVKSLDGMLSLVDLLIDEHKLTDKNSIDFVKEGFRELDKAVGFKDNLSTVVGIYGYVNEDGREGNYSMDLDVVKVSKYDKDILHTLLHEVTHKYTALALKKYPELAGKIDDMRSNMLKKLKYIPTEMVYGLKGTVEEGKEVDQFTRAAEFLAEIVSNPNLRTALVRQNLTLYERLRELAFKIIGRKSNKVKVVENKVLTSIMKEIEAMQKSNTTLLNEAEVKKLNSEIKAGNGKREDLTKAEAEKIRQEAVKAADALEVNIIDLEGCN